MARESQGPWPVDKIVLRDGRPFLPEPPVVPLSEHAIRAKADTTGVEGDYESWIETFDENGPDDESILSDKSVLGPICEILQKKVEKIPRCSPKHGPLYFHLGNCLLRLVEITNTVDRDALLEKSFHYLSQAISALPKDDPLREQSWTKFAYASFLRSKNDDTGFYWSEAIRHGQRSVDFSTTAEGSIDSLGSLAGIIHHRYAERSQLNDLRQGIQRLQRAIDILPETDIARTNMLNSLGSMYGNLFCRTHCIDDIETAIQYQQKALAACKQDNRTHGMILNSLATSFALRSSTQALSTVDINEAITLGQRALATALPDDPIRLTYEERLGKSFKQLFFMTKKIEDLEQALSYEVKILDNTPEDHPDLANRFFYYGESLHERWLLYQNREDIRNSFLAYVKGFLSKSTPVKCLRCGIRALKYASPLPS